MMYRPPDAFSNRWRIRSRWNECIVSSRSSRRWWLNCWRKNEVLVILRIDERCSSSSRNDWNSWNSRRIRDATSRLRLTNNQLPPPG